MSRFALAFAFALACTAACGGKSKPATSTVEHVDEMHDEHEGLPPEVAAFHDRLAPLYHADAGAQRTDDTCAAIPDLEALLANLEQAPPPPTVDATAWGEHVGTLQSTVADLGTDCTSNAAAGFAAKLETVHDAFHALIELLPHDEK